MLNTIKIGLVTASSVAMLTMAPLTFAQDSTGAGLIQHKCDKITLKLDDLVIAAKARQTKIKDVDTKVQDWWTNIGKDKFVSTYGQDAYNTLNADFVTLHNTYGKPLSDDAATYAGDLAKLQLDSQNGDCGISNGSFAQELVNVKKDRNTLHTDITNWRSYFNDTIRAYVQSLKGTTPTVTPAS